MTSVNNTNGTMNGEIQESRDVINGLEQGLKRKRMETETTIPGAPKEKHQYEEIQYMVSNLFKRVKCRPTIGVVCGSGIGGLADVVQEAEVVKYREIPGFPVSTVPGHKGQLVFGKLGGKSVVLMQGRVHFYEGYQADKIGLPIRMMHLMGVKMLILTNAAGGLNESFNVGDIMIIKDHIYMPGFAGLNPLVGINEDKFGPRFPPMSNAYSLKYRKLAHRVAEELGFKDFIREGVYNMLCGPNFETVAECRYLRLIGADATGMSTAPEALIARHCGMELLAMSLITNKCVMEFDCEFTANHEEVLETGEKRSKDFQKLVSKILEELEF